MNRVFKSTLAVLTLSLAAPAFAQGPPGGPPGAGGGFNMPPEMQAKMKAWQKFRENNKNLDKLSQTLRALPRLEEDPQTAFTKDQAKKLLAIYKVERNKPALTDAQASDLNKKVNAILTLNQVKKMNTGRQGMGGGFGGGGRMGGGGGFGGGGGGFRGAGGPPGGGRPGGGGPGGGMGQFKMPDPAPYNPFNPDTNPFMKANPQMAQRMKGRSQEFIGKLEAKAK